jgi:hypothetical protein
LPSLELDGFASLELGTLAELLKYGTLTSDELLAAAFVFDEAGIILKRSGSSKPSDGLCTPYRDSAPSILGSMQLPDGQFSPYKGCAVSS